MARFPYYERNKIALGRMIAKAALDPVFASKLKADPKTALEEVGLPKKTTELMKFKIVDGASYPTAKVIPLKLNFEKLFVGDKDYLRDVSEILN